jgi:transcriptional regulator with XRE-family HTH domain
MDRNSLLRDIAHRLRKIREPLGYTHREMGELINVDRSSYTRYESGETFARMMSLYQLGTKLDISMDWLIINKGPMYYKEKEVNEGKTAGEPPIPGKTLPDDVGELLEIMEKVPVLRYKVLLYFHELKEEHKEMIAAAMKDKKEGG